MVCSSCDRVISNGVRSAFWLYIVRVLFFDFNVISSNGLTFIVDRDVFVVLRMIIVRRVRLGEEALVSFVTSTCARIV